MHLDAELVRLQVAVEVQRQRLGGDDEGGLPVETRPHACGAVVAFLSPVILLVFLGNPGIGLARNRLTAGLKDDSCGCQQK